MVKTRNTPLTRDVTLGLELRSVTFKAPTGVSQADIRLFRTQSLKITRDDDNVCLVAAVDAVKSEPAKGGLAITVDHLIRIESEQFLTEEEITKLSSVVWLESSLLISLMSKLGGGVPLVLPPFYREGKRSLGKLSLVAEHRLKASPVK